MARQMMAANPAQYLARVRASDVKGTIKALWDLPYDADPILEPEAVGMTYGQVILQRQFNAAVHGDGAALDRLLDRMIGKPEAINKNLNANLSYKDWLEEVAKKEGLLDADGRVIEDAEIVSGEQTLQ